VIIQRTENAAWLSNAYLVADAPGGHGVIVDANQAMDPLCERAEREGIDVTHVVLTHHHDDHVEGIDAVARRLGAPILASEAARDDLPDGLVDDTLSDGGTLQSGPLRIGVLETPGHMVGHLCFLFDGTDCFTGDVLFKGTVGGTRAPRATGFTDLRRSVMERLMGLPAATRVHPGHREPTTIGAEWDGNPFVRIWRGLDEPSAEPCVVGRDAAARDATLMLWAPDYDGGHKAWVRFPDGEDAIVGGSQVTRR
jgi:hydroxyacylglutathione hydrolase